MTAREAVLEAFNRLERRTGGRAFSPAEIVAEVRQGGWKGKDSTIRTHVISRMCANAPNHHAVVYEDLLRVDRGLYERRGGPR
jgi:hypothetical protein